MNGMSLFFGNRLHRFLMSPEGDGNQGGGGKGGEGGGNNQGGNQNQNQNVPDPKDDVIAKLSARLEALEKGNKPAPQDDPTLADKARREREAKEKGDLDSKALEKAITFNVASGDWLKNNASILPKTIPGIFEAAGKETYGNAIEKANAIKVGIISEYFAVQDNLELLTESQKSALDDFKKLTKNSKEERVQAVFDTIFEPTFEAQKKILKASQLSKGLGSSSDAETQYRDRMRETSKKHYLKKGS